MNLKNLHTASHSTLIAGALLTLSIPCRAVLIAYDGFDTTEYVAGGTYAAPVYGNSSSSNALVYDADTTVGGGIAQNPPTYGFNGEWRYSDPIAGFIYAKIQNTQLSYSGLDTTTGQMTVARTSASASLKRFDRTIMNGDSTSYGGTIYLAGIIQASASTAFGMKFTYGVGDGRSFQFSVNTTGTTSLTSSFGPAATTADSLWTANTVNFFVLKLENAVLSDPMETSAGDRMTLYINPDLSSEGLNSPVLQYGDAAAQFFVTGNSGFAISNMQLSASPGNGSSVTFDELKIATTWADLTTTIAVPEPSTSLLGLAGFALLFRRKR